MMECRLTCDRRALNNSEEVDLYKEFGCNGVSITRYDFEAMPCPMFAIELGDDVMLKIANDTYGYLAGAGWEGRQISRYLGDVKPNVSELDAAEMIELDAIEADFWMFAEKAAIENGMRYYEDL